jgi:hypothetical protein
MIYCICAAALVAMLIAPFFLVGAASIGLRFLSFPAIVVAFLLAIYLCWEPYVRSARGAISALRRENPSAIVWLTQMPLDNRKRIRDLSPYPEFEVVTENCRPKSFMILTPKSLTLWAQRRRNLERYAVIPAGSAHMIIDPRVLPSNTVELSISSGGEIIGQLLLTPRDGSFFPRSAAREQGYRDVSKWASRAVT